MKLKLSKGFTLIELLVVIAVLGVLAGIVLIAVNPGEQLSRSRDTSRISAITQLGRALQGYYTANTGTYPAESTTWATTLVTSGDLKVAPANPLGNVAAACNDFATLGQSGYCFKTSATETIVYAKLQSTLYTGKCPSANPQPYWVFSAANAKACGVCGAAATDPVDTSVATCTF